MITRRGFLKVLGGGVAGVMALGGYAFAYEPLARLNITRYALTPPGWTPGLKLKVVALADVHACEPWMSASRIAAICARTNELGGDVTVMLGDYASGMSMVTRHLHPSEWSKALATLQAPLGVHAIMGNHDWWEDKDAQTNGGMETFGHRALADVGNPSLQQPCHSARKRRSWLLAGRPGRPIGPSAQQEMGPQSACSASTIWPARWLRFPTMRQSSC